MREYHFESMSQRGLSPFKVSGGPFAKDQLMGWHVTDEKGFTVGVLCSSEFVAQFKRQQADINYWRKKYEDVVKEIEKHAPVSDGGQYRNDVISAIRNIAALPPKEPQ